MIFRWKCIPSKIQSSSGNNAETKWSVLQYENCNLKIDSELLKGSNAWMLWEESQLELWFLLITEEAGTGFLTMLFGLGLQERRFGPIQFKLLKKKDKIELGYFSFYLSNEFWCGQEGHETGNFALADILGHFLYHILFRTKITVTGALSKRFEQAQAFILFSEQVHFGDRKLF